MMLSYPFFLVSDARVWNRHSWSFGSEWQGLGVHGVGNVMN